MYWTLVYLAVALSASPFVFLTSSVVGVPAYYIAVVFAVLSLCAAAAELLERRR